MLVSICPKLPMRDKSATRDFYLGKLGFEDIGEHDYPDYLIIKKDDVEMHFFLFKDLDPAENYGQVYLRVQSIDQLYNEFLGNRIEIHPNGKLHEKPWGQIEFSILDPDNNLITFGQSV